jgi:microsomal epoxide hydrolase
VIWPALACLGLALGLGAAPVERFVVADDGVRLRVLEAGQGRPIVFVPGWGLSAEIFEPAMRDLEDCYRVISFDPRGQGLSDKPLTGYGSLRRAADIKAIVDEGQLDQVLLVGWSMGALEALRYAEQYGGAHLRGLVLIDNSVDRHFADRRAGQSLVDKIEHEPSSVIQCFVSDLFHRQQDGAWISLLCQRVMMMPHAAALEALKRTSSGTGLFEILKKTGLRALYLITPRYEAEAGRLKKALGPQISVELFEDAGHALFADEPQRFMDSLENFSQSLP